MIDGSQTSDSPALNQEAPASAAPSSPREQFISSLPEEYRQDPIFANFENWEGVAKSYAHAAKMVGMDKSQMLALPKEPTPEAMSPIWDKLGRPTDINGYGLDTYKDALDEGALKKYAEIAHKNGVSKDALNSIFSEFVSDGQAAEAAQLEQRNLQIDQWQSEVKKEFGAAYEDKIAFAKKAVQSFGLDEMVEKHMDVFEHPSVIKALVAIGEKTSEGMVLSTGSVSHGRLAPAEAKMELAKFESDRDAVKILMDARHPQHQYMKEKRSELYKYAYPQ